MLRFSECEDFLRIVKTRFGMLRFVSECKWFKTDLLNLKMEIRQINVNRCQKTQNTPTVRRYIKTEKYSFLGPWILVFTLRTLPMCPQTASYSSELPRDARISRGSPWRMSHFNVAPKEMIVRLLFFISKVDSLHNAILLNCRIAFHRHPYESLLWH